MLAHVLGRVRIQSITLIEDARETLGCEERRKTVPDGFGETEEVSTLRIRFRYPYDGDEYLWYSRPPPYGAPPPEGQLAREGDRGLNTFVDVEFERRTDDDPSLYEDALKKWLDSVRMHLNSQREMIDSFYARELPEVVKQAIARRRDVLAKHAAIMRRLNIELTRTPGAPEPIRVPIQRKVIKPPPPLPNAPAQASIRDEDYEHILNVLRHAGRTFEAAPRIFAKFEEEELRYVMLAHLNTHYQGDAGGEVFRGLGKSDIKIEFDNRAAFVAECKVWGGDKEVQAAVTQLHRYLTWRHAAQGLSRVRGHGPCGCRRMEMSLSLPRGS